jgi:hypothetical protein
LKAEYFKQTGSDIPEWMHPEEIAAGYIGRFLANDTAGLNDPQVMTKLMSTLLDNKPYEDSWGSEDDDESKLKWVIIVAVVLLVLVVIAVGIYCYNRSQKR